MTASSRSILSSRSVLIVDDEADIRDSVSDILLDFGYEVETAANGPEALATLEQRPFDVALLDFKMPGMDGLTLYREMRRLWPETSVILVSAYTGDGVAEEALASGIRRVISKPVDMSEVLSEVDRELERPLALVIDDDRDFCESLRDVLAERGFRVSLAGDEESAAKQLQTRQPRAVLLDVLLGRDSDSTRILQSIRDCNPQAEVVVVTGHREETQPQISELVKSGAVAVCFKPLDIQRLLEQLPQPA